MNRSLVVSLSGFIKFRLKPGGRPDPDVNESHFKTQIFADTRIMDVRIKSKSGKLCLGAVK